MKKFIFINVIKRFAVAVSVLCVALWSCSEMNDMHDKYLDGEIIYAAKVDGVDVRSGKNRIILDLTVTTQRIETIRIYWNDYNDSADVAINSQVGLFSKELTNMEEKDYLFYLVSIDKFGNRSLPFEASGKVYGDRYQSQLINRRASAMATSSEIDIQWYTISVDNYVASELRYTDANNVVQTVQVLPDAISTLISDANESSIFEHRAMYIPPNSIDPFYSEWATIAPITKYDKTEWRVISWSDAYTGGGNDGGGAASLFDNNYGQPSWHSGRGSDYGASSFPYWFIVDMGSPKTISKIMTYFTNTNRTARIECYISNSNSIATQGTGNSAIPNPAACAEWGTKISSTEEWNSTTGIVNMLSNAAAGQYLLLYLYEPGPNDDDYHTNIYEIDVYGLR